AGTGEDYRLLAPAARGLGPRQDEMGGKPRRLERRSARLLAHQRVQLQRQHALRIVFVGGEQLVGDDETEHAVAKELEALVRGGVGGARMGQRPLQELGVVERVTQALFEVSQSS